MPPRRPPAPIEGRCIVKTAFPLGQQKGLVFSLGRRARGKAELFFDEVPYDARESATGLLEQLLSLDLDHNDSVADDTGVLVAQKVSSEERARLAEGGLRLLGRRAKVLKICVAMGKDAYVSPEYEDWVKELATTMVNEACTHCGEKCACGEKYMYFPLDGVSTYSGIVAKDDGMYKEHGDGTLHKMTANEYYLDRSRYDHPPAVVPRDLHPAALQRGTPQMQAVLPVVETLLKRMAANVESVVFGRNALLLPGEVRTGDLIVRCDARCKDATCAKCHMLLEVVAVHAGGRGLVVSQKDLPTPFRISMDTVAGCIRAEHWEDGIHERMLE